MIPVVKEADVPTAAQRLEELHQGAGTLRELESAHALGADVRGPSADHVTDIKLRHLRCPRGGIRRLLAQARRRAASSSPSCRVAVAMPTKISA